MTEKAVGYGAKSFDDPDRRTSSVDDQRVAAENYAAAHDLELVAFDGDDGITGATMERPGLQKMLARIASGGIKVLIIEDVDRLGRDQEHLQHMTRPSGSTASPCTPSPREPSTSWSSASRASSANSSAGGSPTPPVGV